MIYLIQFNKCECAFEKIGLCNSLLKIIRTLSGRYLFWPLLSLPVQRHRCESKYDFCVSELMAARIAVQCSATSIFCSLGTWIHQGQTFIGESIVSIMSHFDSVADDRKLWKHAWKAECTNKMAGENKRRFGTIWKFELHFGWRKSHI